MTWLEWLAQSGVLDIRLPIPVALATVSVIGYLLGRRVRKNNSAAMAVRARKEIEAADLMAQELEWIAGRVRKSLARHHTGLARFNSTFHKLGRQSDGQKWQDFCTEAEEILGPTLQLAGDIAEAYDSIRQQSHQLMSFTGAQTDPQTGIGNRKDLNEALGSMLAIKRQYGLQFSVAIIDQGRFRRELGPRSAGHCEKDERTLARLLENGLRKTDILTRSSGGQMVIVMPGTDLAGASTLVERLRQSAKVRHSLAISGGVAMALESETGAALLRRADEALRQAGQTQHDAIMRHDGDQVLAHAESELPRLPAEDALVV